MHREALQQDDAQPPRVGAPTGVEPDFGTMAIQRQPPVGIREPMKARLRPGTSKGEANKVGSSLCYRTKQDYFSLFQPRLFHHYPKHNMQEPLEPEPEV